MFIRTDILNAILWMIGGGLLGAAFTGTIEGLKTGLLIGAIPLLFQVLYFLYICYFMVKATMVISRRVTKNGTTVKEETDKYFKNLNGLNKTEK